MASKPTPPPPPSQPQKEEEDPKIFGQDFRNASTLGGEHVAGIRGLLGFLLLRLSLLGILHTVLDL